MINEFIETLWNCGKELSIDFSNWNSSQLIELCIKIETALFRARIKLEREFNK